LQRQEGGLGDLARPAPWSEARWRWSIVRGITVVAELAASFGGEGNSGRFSDFRYSPIGPLFLERCLSGPAGSPIDADFATRSSQDPEVLAYSARTDWPSESRSELLKRTLWILVVLMIVLQQDCFDWESASLVWGFLPQTLLYQASISIATAIVWLIAVRFCWPEDGQADGDVR
jgi:hypothetical protein